MPQCTTLACVLPLALTMVHHAMGGFGALADAFIFDLYGSAPITARSWRCSCSRSSPSR